MLRISNTWYTRTVLFAIDNGIAVAHSMVMDRVDSICCHDESNVVSQELLNWNDEKREREEKTVSKFNGSLYYKYKFE